MPWSPCPIFEKSDISAETWEVRIEIWWSHRPRILLNSWCNVCLYVSLISVGP